MAQKPSIPKGTRDFSPSEVAKRNYIFSTIRQVFETYGFQPIETPSFENSETLMGKYGEEGDRLIFKILESGEYFNSIKDDLMQLDRFKSEISNLVKKNYNIILKFIKDNNINSRDYYNNNSPLLNALEFQILKREGYFKFDSLQRFFENNRHNIIEKLLNNHYENARNKNLEIRTLNSLFSEIYEKTVISYLNDNQYKVYREFRDLKSSDLTSKISEKALRYDLTVPFARYVVQHQNEIEFPFKRYQMQPVWRADRPQKGRFREFYQCDADVVGSKSLWQEIEFVQLYDAVFSKLKLTGTTIKLNNRKILAGIAEIIGAADKLIDFTVALDKLDKIGADGVAKEMMEKGISEQAIEKVKPLFNFTGSNQNKLDQLATLLAESKDGTSGVKDLRFVVDAVEKFGLESAKLIIDVTLARGLNYYTGAIYEVSAPEGVNMGSIGGGGRYDDLTGIFGLNDMSGVGISFGLDRIYLVLEELNLFTELELPKPKVLFINFGDAEAAFCMQALVELRKNDIKSELYPDNAKLKKQMNYANKREIPYVVMVGSSEIENNTYTLKNMQSGEQEVCSLKELIRITAQL